MMRPGPEPGLHRHLGHQQVEEYTGKWNLNRANRFYWESEERYDLVHLERMPRGTPYTGVVDGLVELANSEQLRDQALLIVDATGLGKPVFDMAVERYHQGELDFWPRGVTNYRRE